MTPFQKIYDCFLSKITDDMYIELTPTDTKRDCQALLKNNLSKFEFPRFPIFDYVILDVIEEWDAENNESVYTDQSFFNSNLHDEEINILAIIMMEAWLSRQIASIEYTRMKYFKMSSQANHLAKLIDLREEFRKENIHAQRLYKRRKVDEHGKVSSNWSSIMEKSALN